MEGTFTRGVVFVHSSTSALCRHIEWTLGTILGRDVRLDWTAQPAAPGMLRGEYSWVGPVGTGPQIASAMRGWEHLRYEVTEEATASTNGARYSHTPALGIFHAQIDAFGNTVIPEDRVRNAIQNSTDMTAMRAALDLAVGQAWDNELEPFRYAGGGAPVRWLHGVG